MKGKLIVFEGLDGSGKATQTDLLVESLLASGVPVRKLDFPRYDKPTSTLAKIYLDGYFGSAPGDVNCYAASVFFGVDRYASFKTEWEKSYNEGGVFVSNRYTTSNALYQTSKLPRGEWDGFLDWLFDIEYNKFGIPAPDGVILLDVSADTSERLMEKRYAGDKNKMDIHERDLSYQRVCREVAQHCVRTRGWKTVPCDVNGSLRRIEDIAADVLVTALEVIK